MAEPDNLQEKIAQELATELMSHVDFEVLANMLVDIGWHRRFIRYQPPEKSWILIKDWVDKNCKGSHQEHNGIWLFETEQDAVWFDLRWT